MREWKLQARPRAMFFSFAFLASFPPPPKGPIPLPQAPTHSKTKHRHEETRKRGLEIAPRGLHKVLDEHGRRVRFKGGRICVWRLFGDDAVTEVFYLFIFF